MVAAEKGFFATANEMNLPDNFPHPVGYEWIDRARTDRIHDRLHALENVSVDDS